MVEFSEFSHKKEELVKYGVVLEKGVITSRVPTPPKIPIKF